MFYVLTWTNLLKITTVIVVTFLICYGALSDAYLEKKNDSGPKCYRRSKPYCDNAKQIKHINLP